MLRKTEQSFFETTNKQKQVLLKKGNEFSTPEAKYLTSCSVQAKLCTMYELHVVYRSPGAFY